MADKRTYSIELKSGGVLYEHDLLQDDLEGIVDGTHVIVPKELTDGTTKRAKLIYLNWTEDEEDLTTLIKEIYKVMIKERM